ncbi:hypothetical protein TWF481_009284 [Arthrobotrys musiformis]|uniref:Peptidase S33 tripeptidyl aminopeptidase-like C-terminal domain-containing protein n=1 Tax=Arthrobotrys musiformis TaxID=47236 RepID=A0AAV9W3D2_9PEZI
MLRRALLSSILLYGAEGLDLNLGASHNPFILKRQALRERLFENIPATVDLKWYPCSNETTEITFECARLSVPLDYKKPENGLRAIVPIIKYPADKNVPYKGSVLVNPGGPGGMGSELIYDVPIAKQIRANVVGPGWDILGFDPRGIGYAVPYGSCDIIRGSFEPERQNATKLFQKSPSKAPKSRRGSTKLPANNDEVAYGVLIPDDPPSWKSRSYQDAYQFNYACQEYVSQYDQAGPHMNTVVVATDMLSIAKALARERKQPENTALVNFYGISYGTVIGQYFATHYPNNVGKFFLDGVVDAETWISHDDVNTTVTHADKAWSLFFTSCFNAGPKKCSFFTGRNSHAIRDRFNTITARLNATKYELEESEHAFFVTSILLALKSILFNSIYSAYHTWPLLADFFVAAEPIIVPDPAKWDLDALQQAFLELQMQNGVTYAPVTSIPESFTEVSCTDARDIRGVEITPAEEQAWKTASRVGGSSKLDSRIRCSQWQIRPSWEWYGPVGGATKTPILFAGTLLDPITPFENSEKAMKLFKGAKMFYVDEIAHTTLNTRNTCAFGHALAYFQNGTLPGHNNRCSKEIQPFF